MRLQLPLHGVEEENDSSLYNVPLVESKFVDEAGDEAGFRNTDSSQQRLLPERTSTYDGCECVYDTKDNDTLDWAGDNAESQGFRVVLIPSLDVECKKSYTQSSQQLTMK